jgi:hypothetical protein
MRRAIAPPEARAPARAAPRARPRRRPAARRRLPRPPVPRAPRSPVRRVAAKADGHLAPQRARRARRFGSEERRGGHRVDSPAGEAQALQQARLQQAAAEVDPYRVLGGRGLGGTTSVFQGVLFEGLNNFRERIITSSG